MKMKAKDTRPAPTSDGGNDNFFFRAKRWLDNYFYHYKWHTVLGGFLLFVSVWCVASACSQTGTEFMLGYVGSYTFSNDEIAAISDAMSDAIARQTGSGEKIATDVNAITYVSLSEAEEKFAFAEEVGWEYRLSPQGNALNYQNFQKQFEMGDVAVWLMSADVYSEIDRGMLIPLSEIFETMPEEATDGYAVLTDALPFKKANMKKVTDGSVLVMRRKYNTALRTDSTEAAEVERSMVLFRAIVNAR